MVLIRAMIQDTRPLIGHREAENIQESVRSLGEVIRKGKKLTAQRPMVDKCAACRRDDHSACVSKYCECGRNHL